MGRGGIELPTPGFSAPHTRSTKTATTGICNKRRDFSMLAGVDFRGVCEVVWAWFWASSARSRNAGPFSGCTRLAPYASHELLPSAHLGVRGQPNDSNFSGGKRVTLVGSATTDASATAADSSGFPCQNVWGTGDAKGRVRMRNGAGRLFFDSWRTGPLGTGRARAEQPTCGHTRQEEDDAGSLVGVRGPGGSGP